jgi:ankyrin repeat protein
MEVIVLILLAVVYFAPTITASQRNHPNRDAITIVNLFLGWTVIGWVVALAWASTAITKTNVDDSKGDTRECPFCAEIIRRKAKVCRFCSHDLSESERQKQPASIAASRDELGIDDPLLPPSLPKETRPTAQRRFMRGRANLPPSLSKEKRPTAQRRFMRGRANLPPSLSKEKRPTAPETRTADGNEKASAGPEQQSDFSHAECQTPGVPDLKRTASPKQEREQPATATPATSESSFSWSLIIVFGTVLFFVIIACYWPKTQVPTSTSSRRDESTHDAAKEKPPTAPPDVACQIISAERYPQKTTLKIRLSRRILGDELRAIALKLRQQERTASRLFVSYYLPGMRESQDQPWALTHFTPELEMAIKGLTEKEEESLERATEGGGATALGRWLDEVTGIKAVVIIRQNNGEFVIENTYTDGSHGTRALAVKTVNGERRFYRMDGNPTGDYYVIEGSGKLAIYDNDGLITELPPVQSRPSAIKGLITELPPAQARPTAVKELFVAAGEGDYDQVQRGLAAKPDLNAKVKGITALHAAAFGGHKRVVELLLAHGANIEVKDDNEGVSPLHVATMNGHRDVVELLLSRGAAVSAATEHGNVVPLCIAAERGDVEMMRLLLSHGAQVNVRVRTGITPLCIVASRGYRDAAALLLDKGADVNAKSDTSATALMTAVKQGDKEMVSLLLSKNADVNIADNTGATPLGTAVLNKRADLAGLLISKGAAINSADKFSRTPLHAAARCGTVELVELLLKNGADGNAKSYLGETPLHEAAACGRDDVVEVLLEKGAEINAKDRQGRTPLDVATGNATGVLVKRNTVQRRDLK